MSESMELLIFSCPGKKMLYRRTVRRKANLEEPDKEKPI